MFKTNNRKLNQVKVILPIKFMYFGCTMVISRSETHLYIPHVFWLYYGDTVAPRNTGSQGTNKFHLLLTDFRYCQYRTLKEMT